jgi:hypothetical protein
MTKMNIENSTTIELEVPITFADEKVTQITLRRPVARDLRKLSLSPCVGDFLDLAKHLSDVFPAIIDELSFNDTWAVVGALANFTQSSPPTGKTS